MKRLIFVASCLLTSISTGAYAGLFYSSHDSRGSAIASVEIEDKGIYNLIITVQFLNKPFDKREYTSDAYESLINRLSVEWQDVALKIVLESNKYKISDLPKLEAKVDSELEKLVKAAKKKHGIGDTIEVVYSISNFYLVEMDGD